MTSQQNTDGDASSTIPTKYGYNNQDYPQSEKYYSEAISLPIFPSLREAEQERVVDLLATQTGHQTIF